MMFFYFSLFKYLFLVIGSPVFRLSERKNRIHHGRKGIYIRLDPFFFTISSAGLNWLFEIVSGKLFIPFSFSLLSLIPLVGSIAPVISGLVECYFYGFSMLDYSCEAASFVSLGQHPFHQSAPGTGDWQRLGFLPDAFCSLCGLGAGTFLCTGCRHHQSVSSEY